MNQLQQEASNPEYSVWVSASAGTGKTKILIDRILRLLIAGTPAQKILCLTFTNAAALEMQSRINNKLAKFAVEDDDKLLEELNLLLTRTPLVGEIQKARSLYYQLIDRKDNVNIYTIHAFCQKMLKIFPLEAGINPEFQVLDDFAAQGILRNVRNQLYLDPNCHELIKFFLSNFHEVTINDIFAGIIQQKIKFKKLFTKPIEYIKHDTQVTYQQLLNIYDKAEQLLTKYQITIDSVQDIRQFFLTKEGLKRKNMLSKSTLMKYPRLLTELELIQEEIWQLDQQAKMQDMENYSNLLRELAKNFLDKYESYKTEHNLLDYDDLIYFTRVLLTDNITKSWIAYKLDGGIDHLLVDEAQDTSEEQWDIVTTIIADFGSNTKPKNTIFVVGDEKQSIFSFQGANLGCFNDVNKNLDKHLCNNFKNISLVWSYRSTKEIIDIVHLMLQQIKDTTPQLFPSDNPKILPFRKSHRGRIELWSLVSNEKENKLFWPLPSEYSKSGSPEQLLARQIANFIKNQIASKRILHATNCQIKESDFMILVRKRDELVFEIIDCLKQYGLAVEDLDRITLDENLSALDLMSIARFVLLPQDDLNLASLLKSPIIGVSEQQLQFIAIARGKNSIWGYLHANSDYADLCKKLGHFLQLYKIADCGKFFSLIVDCLGVRKILVQSNGFNSNDAINELLALSRNYSNNVDSLLQSFVNWFDNNKIEIKRNLESSSKIKVMTAHASKGLQAPIVILCDTNSLPINNNKFIWDQHGQLFSCIQTSDSPEFLKNLNEQERQKDLQEYIRLLYVAMTRAEDQLIICGYQSNNKLPENCWYELVARTMNIYGKVQEDGVIVYETAIKHSDDIIPAWSGIHKNAAMNETNKAIDSRASRGNDIISENDLESEFLRNSCAINNVTKDTRQNYSVNSPLITNDYLEYGKIFHKILDDASKACDFSKMNKHPLIDKLPITLYDKIHKNINKLSHNKEFTELLSCELRSEVTVGIKQNDNRSLSKLAYADSGVKIGRIDLLAISAKEITIIDYKSDASPPETSQLVKAAYIDQMNFYRHIMTKLYPYHKIICKILWLENGEFMTI